MENDLELYRADLEDYSGLFDINRFCIRLSFSKDQIVDMLNHPDDPNNVDELAVLIHELHHFYTIASSSFGFFLTSLRSIQNAVAAKLSQTIIAENGYIKKPLASLFDSDLSNRKDMDIYRSFFNYWRMLGKLSYDFWGYGTSTLGEINKEFNSIYRLNSYFANIHNIDIGEAYYKNNHDESHLIHCDPGPFFLGLKRSDRNKRCNIQIQDEILGPYTISWLSLIETAAEQMENIYEWYNPIYQDRTVELYHSERYKYCMPFYYMYGQFKNIDRRYDGNQVLDRFKIDDQWTFLAIYDISINPSIDILMRSPHEDMRYRGIIDFLPSHRFVKVCQAAKNVERFDMRKVNNYGDLNDQYIAFVSEICEQLDYETPWEQADRILDQFEIDDFVDHPIFIKCCEYRRKYPSFFALYNAPGNPYDLLRSIGYPMIISNDQHCIEPNVREKYFLSLVSAGMLSILFHQLFLESGPLDVNRIDAIRYEGEEENPDKGSVYDFISELGIPIDIIKWDE